MPNIIRFGYSGTSDIDVGPSYFGDGSDGVGLFTSNTTWEAETQDTGMIVKNFESLTIAEGVTVAAGNRNCGMVIYVNGDCTINGTLANKMSPKTLLDSDNVDFSIYPPSMLTSSAGNGGNGGSSGNSSGGAGMVGRFYGGGWSGGGVGGSYSVSSSYIGYAGGSGGSVADVTTAIPDSSLFKGGASQMYETGGISGSYGGGGSGAVYGETQNSWSGAGGSSPGANGNNSSTNYGSAAMGGGGAGNYGGGVIILFVAGTLTINGIIDCSGGNGGNGGTCSGGNSRGYYYASQGGGGAGGGRIYIVHQSEYVLAGTLNVSGGSGGTYGNISNSYKSFSLGSNGTAGTAGDTTVYTLAQYKSKELGINDGIELLNMTIVGGTEQPENPAENTVWVNTETEIAGVYLSPNAPDAPAAGDVWINTAVKYSTDGTAASTNMLTINDSPFLEINVSNIYQHDGSAWVETTGSAIYVNGAWTYMALYIFNYGNRNINYPLYYGQYSGSNATSQTLSFSTGSVSYSGDYVRVATSEPSSGTLAAVLKTDLIDLTPFSKITLTFKNALTNSTARYRPQLGIGSASSGITHNSSLNISIVDSTNTTSVQTITIDIGGLAGNYYVAAKWLDGNYPTFYYIALTA